MSSAAAGVNLTLAKAIIGDSIVLGNLIITPDNVSGAIDKITTLTDFITLFLPHKPQLEIGLYIETTQWYDSLGLHTREKFWENSLVAGPSLYLTGKEKFDRNYSPDYTDEFISAW